MLDTSPRPTHRALASERSIGCSNETSSVDEEVDSDGFYESPAGPDAVSNIAGTSARNQLELSLLRVDDPNDISDEENIPRELGTNDVQTALLFSSQLLQSRGSNGGYSQQLPQYGLMGRVLSTGTTVQGGMVSQEQQCLEARVFLNTNIPGSFFICGLQGSGKSHTLATLLENYLIASPQIGVLCRPLSALVLHFGEYTSKQAFRPCEAAYLAKPSPPKIPFSDLQLPKVKVLVPPSNYRNLAAAYKEVPHATVHPLKFHSHSLTIKSMLTLMAVSRSGSPPLYMYHVAQELRSMAESEGAEGFDYKEFKKRMEKVKKLLNDNQEVMLNQRLRMLDSFVDVRVGTDIDATEFAFGGAEGELTIVDLSCPFVDDSFACGLFDVAIGQYLSQSSTEVGKVIALDEAHKVCRCCSCLFSWVQCHSIT